MNAAGFCARVQKQLALNWLRHLERLEILDVPRRSRGLVRLHSDLKCLLEVERRQCPKNEGPIFLHELLRKASPTYGRIFDLADATGIGLEAKFVSRMRFIEDYNPYRSAVIAPVVREEVEWLLDQPIAEQPAGTLEVLADLLKHNFPVYHEMAHGFFNRVVTMARVPRGTMPSKKTSDDYFLFIESLVGVQETLVAEELGSCIGDSLHKANATYRKVPPGQLARTYAPSTAELAGCLLTHLGSIRGLTSRELTRRLPSWAPFDARQTVGYHADFFVHELIPRWLSKHRFDPRAAKASGVSAIKPLRLHRFDLDYFLKNSGLVGEICSWLSELFEYGAHQ